MIFRNLGSSLYIFTTCIVLSCKSNKLMRTEVLELIKSENACDRIRGFQEIERNRDTSLYKFFFEKVNDLSITHCTDFYGKTVIWSKVQALEKITGKQPLPHSRDLQPDTTVLLAYKRDIDSILSNH